MRVILKWVFVFLLVFTLYKLIDKDSLIQVIYQSLPPKEASLLGGMLLGDTTGFEWKLVNDFKRSGIIHLVVVSGSNIMLLSCSVVESLAIFLGRKRAILLGLIIAWYYVFLVGFQIPAIRAVLLVSIFYWAQILGRKFSLGRCIALVIVMMVLADYTMLIQVSFWLSFGAFLALVKKPNFKFNSLLNTIGETLWVSLWVTPILAYSFGQISLVSVLSNALVLGLVEIITLVGGLGVLLGVFSLMLGKIILLTIYPLLKYLLVVVESLSSLAWASVEFKFNWGILIGWYLLLVGLILRRKNEN